MTNHRSIPRTAASLCAVALCAVAVFAPVVDGPMRSAPRVLAAALIALGATLVVANVHRSTATQSQAGYALGTGSLLVALNIVADWLLGGAA